MRYSKYTIAIANTFGLTPEQAQGIEIVYDLISRFGFVSSVAELKRVGYHNGGDHPLPRALFDFIADTFLSKGIRTYYRFSDLHKSEKLLPFARYLIQQRIQPKDLYFDGVLIIKDEDISGGKYYVEVEYNDDYETKL